MLFRKCLLDRGKARHPLVDELIAVKQIRYAEEVNTELASILEKLKTQPLRLHAVSHRENKKVLAGMGFKIHSGDYGDYAGVPDR